MPLSLIWYLRTIARPGWIRKFFTVRTAPLVTPPYFRGFPEPTGRTCTHALYCMMVCPAPGAIEVVRKDGGWMPRIHRGHCIRCGLCVEACPNGVLASGNILGWVARDSSLLSFRFTIGVDHDKCMGCGNCAVACPVNRELDITMGGGGHASVPDLLLRVDDGKCRVIHEEKCTGCKSCEDNCPTGAIQVARHLEAIQEVG